MQNHAKIGFILELRAAGRTYTQIATEVGLSPSRVGELIRQVERRKFIAQMNTKNCPL